MVLFNSRLDSLDEDLDSVVGQQLAVGFIQGRVGNNRWGRRRPKQDLLPTIGAGRLGSPSLNLLSVTTKLEAGVRSVQPGVEGSAEA